MNRAKYVKNYHRCVELGVLEVGGKGKKMSHGELLIYIYVQSAAWRSEKFQVDFVVLVAWL